MSKENNKQWSSQKQNEQWFSRKYDTSGSPFNPLVTAYNNLNHPGFGGKQINDGAEAEDYWVQAEGNLTQYVENQEINSSLSAHIDKLILALAPCFFWSVQAVKPYLSAHPQKGNDRNGSLIEYPYKFLEERFEKDLKPKLEERATLPSVEALTRILQPKIMKTILRIIRDNLDTPESDFPQSSVPTIADAIVLQTKIEQDLIQNMQACFNEIRDKIKSRLNSPALQNSRWLCCAQYVNQLLESQLDDQFTNLDSDCQLEKLRLTFHHIISTCHFMFETHQETWLNPRFGSRIGTELYREFEQLRNHIDSSPLADSFYHWHSLPVVYTPFSSPNSSKFSPQQIEVQTRFNDHLKERDDQSVQQIITGHNGKTVSFASHINEWMQAILNFCYRWLNQSLPETDVSKTEQPTLSIPNKGR